MYLASLRGQTVKNPSKTSVLEKIGKKMLVKNSWGGAKTGGGANFFFGGGGSADLELEALIPLSVTDTG